MTWQREQYCRASSKPRSIWESARAVNDAQKIKMIGQVQWRSKRPQESKGFRFLLSIDKLNPVIVLLFHLFFSPFFLYSLTGKRLFKPALTAFDTLFIGLLAVFWYPGKGEMVGGDGAVFKKKCLKMSPSAGNSHCKYARFRSRYSWWVAAMCILR